MRDEVGLVDDMRRGNRLALARLLTLVENGAPAGIAALNALFPDTGRAHLIGVTGAPGAGKSSLVNQLAHYYRHPTTLETPDHARIVDPAPAPRRVAVVAVDPSSPFSGGAVLGDRVRMRDLAGDPGVFIRSMASRGALGGLAHTTAAVVQVLAAAGFDLILIETVGAGQDEVDIARLAHTTLVIEAPGGGDDIQSIKAGILEIADILVVNKADRPGVENTERILRAMLEMSPHTHPPYSAIGTPQSPLPNPPFWIPAIVRTVATLGTGIPDLAAAIAAHRAYLDQSGEKQRREDGRLQVQLEALLSDTLLARFRAHVSPSFYEATLLALRQRQLSPHEAVQRLLDQA